MKGRIIQINDNKYQIQIKSLLFPWSYLVHGYPSKRCTYSTIEEAEKELKDYLDSVNYKKKIIKVIK